MNEPDLARQEAASLRCQVEELKAAFDRLTEAMEKLKMLAIVMYAEGVTDCDVSLDTIKRMPQDRVVVFGDSKVGGLRVRLMAAEAARALQAKL